jgi:hypothetical protein
VDEKVTMGLVLFLGGVLYIEGVPQRVWKALWGPGHPLVAGQALSSSPVSLPPGASGSAPPPAGTGGASAIADQANQFIGQATAFGKSVAGYCLRFVQDAAQAAGVPVTRVGSAIAAEQEGSVNPSCNAPAGSFVYFDTSWDPNGHVGISNGDGTMTSGLASGVARSPYCVGGYLGWSPAR